MSDNQVVLATILGILTVTTLIVFASTFRHEAPASMADRRESLIGLAMPEGLRLLISQKLMFRRRISLASTLLAAWAVMPLVWSLDGEDGGGYSLGILVLVGAAVAGRSMGTAMGALQGLVEPPSNAIRYARPRAVGLSDYITPLERRGAWVAVTFAALAVVASILTPNTQGTSSLLSPVRGMILLSLAAVFLVFFETVGRRIVSRAQPTGSEPELVWGDAMRSADARSLVNTPITFGFYGAFFGFIDLVGRLGKTMSASASGIFANVGGLVGIAIVMGFAIYSMASQPERYFLKRLWPQYVDVGSPTALVTGPHHTDPAS